MAPIPPIPQESPTIQAAIAHYGARRPPMGRKRVIRLARLGGPCERELWNEVHSPHDPLPIEPRGRLLIASNYRTEDILVELMQSIPGVDFYTNDEYAQNGRINVEHFGGKLAGIAKGVAYGILEAPEVRHVWGCKVANDKDFRALVKLREKDEKQALKKWNEALYAEAVVQMHTLEAPRHFMMVATPGARDITSVRTNADPVFAAELLQKAERIITSEHPQVKVSDNPEWHQCRFCQWRHVCHGESS